MRAYEVQGNCSNRLKRIAVEGCYEARAGHPDAIRKRVRATIVRGHYVQTHEHVRKKINRLAEV